MLAKKNKCEDGGWKLEDGIRRAREKFHSPFSILNPRFLALAPLALAVFISGCSPSGQHALLKGKEFLDRGDYAGAVAQLKIATSLLATNAQAWNYLGLAYHHAGQPADAVVAYQRAFTLDRDLAEAHYNLGCLWLEQNKPDAARTEFTAYTLRRSNAPEGWLKLGLAQLRTHELTAAEKSFNTALYLNLNNAEALNGLGLAQMQRDRPREAAQEFGAAVKAHPDYAPAILNLATVAQEYLHDNKLALQYYRDYLALTPRQANWNEVNAIASSLAPPAIVATAKPTLRPAPGSQNAAPAPAASETRTQTATAAHPSVPATAQPVVRTEYNPPPPRQEPPAQVVEVQPEPTIVATPGQTPAKPAPSVYAPAGPVPAQKPGVWYRLNPAHWFRSSASQKQYDEGGVTPLPPPGSDEAVNPPPSPPPKTGPTSVAPTRTSAPPAAATRPANAARPTSAPSAFPRYAYRSPHEPKPGDRQTATGLFTRAREFEQEQHWLDAMKAYQQAAETDPSWFEAQYNFGVLSYRLRNFQPALKAYEMALAIRPDSVDARYNFALALKAAGYVPDAVNELEKIVKGDPGEARAHLALGNLYAQQLHDVARARQQYLTVLELDPANSQASDIQFWLSSNPP